MCSCVLSNLCGKQSADNTCYKMGKRTYGFDDGPAGAMQISKDDWDELVRLFPRQARIVLYNMMAKAKAVRHGESECRGGLRPSMQPPARTAAARGPMARVATCCCCAAGGVQRPPVCVPAAAAAT